MTRKTWTVTWMAALIGIFLATAAECRGADDPAKVTQAFWKTLNSGGLKAAKPYMTKAGQAAVDNGMTFNMRGVNIITGETKIQGDRATVIITSPEKPGEQHTTIVMKEDGKWKVALMQTLKGMLGEEGWKQLQAFQGKTFDELLAGPEIGKQMKEPQEKLHGELFEKLSTAMTATGVGADMQASLAGMQALMAKAMDTTVAEPEVEIFLLTDMGWGDPFIDPRDRVKGTPTPDDVILKLGDEKKKIWEDALSTLTVQVIIGFENDLAAVVADVRVRPGDTIMADKLKFKVEKITSDTVHLRCISEEKAHEKFLGITVKKKIVL